jgi:hypothetical protein
MKPNGRLKGNKGWGGIDMLREVTRAYAQSFRESGWLVRIQHLYLLAIPVLIVGLALYLSTQW